jgi:hypothetical protein
MRLPGFDAERSLSPAAGHYLTGRATRGVTAPVVPQLQAGIGSSSCQAACRCCKWGNRFCCSHCRWCSGPIGSTAIDSLY